MQRGPVLHVIPFLWSGAGAVVTRLCESQRRQGPVAIVTTGRRGDLTDWSRYRARLRRAGVGHHAIDFFTRDAQVFWESVDTLSALLRTLRPAVVHAHAGVPCCAAVIARDRLGLRTRIIGQMYSWGTGRPGWMNRQDAWGFSRTDRVVCSARAYMRILVEHGVPARKLRYVPWGLPLDQLSAAAGKRRVSTSPFTFGFVGRIEPRKGQLLLVEALAHVRRRISDARLELVGPVADEAYLARVRATIAARGLDGSVLLAGEVPDVTRYVARWDAFVSVSEDEGQGLAVLEAMALGVPVVARVVNGIADYFEDDATGFEVRGTLPGEVADTVGRLATAPDRRACIVQGARRLVAAKYDWERTCRSFDRIYWRTTLQRSPR